MWRFVSLLTFGTKKKAKFRAIFGKIGLAIGAVVDTKRKCFLKSGTKRYALRIWPSKWSTGPKISTATPLNQHSTGVIS